jgi:hypothetical protein
MNRSSPRRCELERAKPLRPDAHAPVEADKLAALETAPLFAAVEP